VVVVVPLAPGAPADATEEAAAGVELAGIGETTAVDVASGDAEEAPVAKTPGEPAEDAPETGAEEATGGLEPNPDEAVVDGTAGGLVPTPGDVGDTTAEVPTEEGLPGATAAAPPQTTCGGKLTPIVPLTTEEPGSG